MVWRLLARVRRLPAVRIEEPRHLWHAPLSAREAELAEMILAGLRNGEIAQLVNLPERAVEARILWMMQKLAVTKRSDIAAWVRRSRPS